MHQQHRNAPARRVSLGLAAAASRTPLIVVFQCYVFGEHFKRVVSKRSGNLQGDPTERHCNRPVRRYVMNTGQQSRNSSRFQPARNDTGLNSIVEMLDSDKAR